MDSNDAIPLYTAIEGRKHYKGRHGGRPGGKGEKEQEEVLQKLELGLESLKPEDNPSLATAIASGMRCLAGTMEEITSNVDPATRMFVIYLCIKTVNKQILFTRRGSKVMFVTAIASL